MSDLTTRQDRDWTQGPILRNVFGLAWPSVLSMILMTAFAITDAFFLGRLGTVPLAAAISAIFVVWMLHSVIEIVTTGTTAVVARCVGEGRNDEAARAATQSRWWGMGGDLGGDRGRSSGCSSRRWRFGDRERERRGDRERELFFGRLE
jgi:Na+-driven multidrug efflux pump